MTEPDNNDHSSTVAELKHSHDNGNMHSLESGTSSDSDDDITIHSDSSRRLLDHQCPRRKTSKQTHKFICDSGGGRRPTIHEKAWQVCHETGMTARISPCQSNQTFEHPVVSAITKADVANLTTPVLLKVNHAALVPESHDANENESLLTTWDISEHGVIVNGVHPSAPKCRITVDGTFLEFDWDDEAVFFSISKPTPHDLDTFDIHELNSSLPPSQSIHRLPDPTRHDKFKSIPMGELRKRFAHLPEKVIQHSLDNTTQHHLDVLEETRENPQRHF